MKKYFLPLLLCGVWAVLQAGGNRGRQPVFPAPLTQVVGLTPRVERPALPRRTVRIIPESDVPLSTFKVPIASLADLLRARIEGGVLRKDPSYLVSRLDEAERKGVLIQSLSLIAQRQSCLKMALLNRSSLQKVSLRQQSDQCLAILVEVAEKVLPFDQMIKLIFSFVIKQKPSLHEFKNEAVKWGFFCTLQKVVRYVRSHENEKSARIFLKDNSVGQAMILPL